MESDADQSGTYDFSLVIQSNCDLSCNISEINDDIGEKQK